MAAVSELRFQLRKSSDCVQAILNSALKNIWCRNHFTHKLLENFINNCKETASDINDGTYREKKKNLIVYFMQSQFANVVFG